MKLTEDEIEIENVMAEVTGEIVSLYVQRTYILDTAYTAKVPSYILKQGVTDMYYSNSVLSVRTKTNNTYTIELLTLDPPDSIEECSLHVADWDTQEVLYED